MGNHPRNYEALRQSERDGEAIRNAEPVRPPNPYQPLEDTHKQAHSQQAIPRTDDQKFEEAVRRDDVKRRIEWENKRGSAEDAVRLDRQLAAEPRDAKIRRLEYEAQDKKALEAGEAYAKSKGKTLSLDQQRRLDSYREIDGRVEQEHKDDGRDR